VRKSRRQRRNRWRNEVRLAVVVLKLDGRRPPSSSMYQLIPVVPGATARCRQDN
jgi:hypothetical protein